MAGKDTNCCAEVIVHGLVQGVGYRAWCARMASTYRLCGSVQNLDDGSVKVIVQGPQKIIDAFIALLRNGPPMANVTKLDVSWDAISSNANGFEIL